MQQKPRALPLPWSTTLKPNLHVNPRIQLHPQRLRLKLWQACSRPARRRPRVPPFQCRHSLLALPRRLRSRLAQQPRQHHHSLGLRLLSPALLRRHRRPYFLERRLLLGLA